MWILATDVRDDRRMAFPQFNTAVSYDVKEFKEEIDRRVQQASNKIGPTIRQVESEVELKLLSSMPEHLEGMPYEAKEKVDEVVSAVRAMLNDQLESISQDARRMNTVEAQLYFQGEIYPVRAVRIVTSWSDVSSYTGREEHVDTTNIPSIDDRDDLSAPEADE